MSLHLVADLEANKQRFIVRVRKSRQVWGLRTDDGWVTCPSNYEETNVLLFWSDEAYARRHAVAEWASHSAVPIDLHSFMDCWLPGMHETGLLAGLNFNAHLAGLEVDPLELANALVAQQ
jgi:hypothetical protein